MVLELAPLIDSELVPGSKQPAKSGAKRGTSTRRTWRRMAAVLGLVALGVLGYAAIELYPWMRMPETSPEIIDARWAKVTEWARVDGSADEPSQELARAAEAFSDFELEGPPSGLPGPHAPTIEFQSLSSERRAALTGLVSWFQGGAPFPPRHCDIDAAPLPLHAYKLGRVALATATQAEDLVRVEAVLALAQRMRQRGNLVELALGARLAETAAEWSRERRVLFPEAFARYQPRPGEIHAALCRDAVCSASLLDPDRHSREHSPFGDGNGVPFGLVSMNRERRVLMDFYGAFLERANAVRDDWRQVERLYGQAAEDRPKSVVLDAVVVQASLIAGVGAAMDGYDEIVTAR
jgi:hypothetical protein